MSRRATQVAHAAGAFAIAYGALSAILAWIVLSDGATRGLLFALAMSSRNLAFADGLVEGLGQPFALPGLVLTEPLVWLGTALVLTPSVYRRLSRRPPADDPAYAGYAYVECPECRHVVPMSAKRCPLCAAELFAPWANATRQA